MHVFGRQWLSPCQLAQQEANTLLTFLGEQKGLDSVAQTVVIITFHPKLTLPFPGITAQSHRSIELEGSKAVIMSGGAQTLFVKP